MPDAKSRSDPSMEEIIASISRVIAEDRHPTISSAGEAQPGAKISHALVEGSDVLELTQVVDEDGSVRRIPPRTTLETASASAAEQNADLRAVSARAQFESPSNEPRLGQLRERIVSTAASGAAAAAFAQLGSLPRDRRREGEPPTREVARTFEDTVRDMLRAMLRSWLDEHLPDIVERLVREEIARVVGESGLR
jgi:uncharacterized protein